MTFQSRVRKIETSLPPTQAVRLWLAEAQQFSDYKDYVQETLAGPLTEAPRVKVHAQVAEAMREAVKFEFSWSAKTKTRAVSEATMQADFLVVLVIQLNQHLSNKLDHSALLLWALAEQRRRMADDVRRFKRCDGEEWAEWCTAIEDLYSRLQIWKAAAAKISRKCFDGDCCLFANQRSELDDEIANATVLACVYNKIHRLPSWSAIKLPAAPSPAKTQILVRRLEDFARVEMLKARGDGEGAWKIAQAHFHRAWAHDRTT